MRGKESFEGIGTWLDFLDLGRVYQNIMVANLIYHFNLLSTLQNFHIFAFILIPALGLGTLIPSFSSVSAIVLQYISGCTIPCCT